MHLLSNRKITNNQKQDAIPLPDDRREALRIWLFANRRSVTLTSLAALLGVTHGALSQALGKERMSTRDHGILLAAGIPPNLLPRPEDVRPGPKQGRKGAASSRMQSS